MAMWTIGGTQQQALDRLIEEKLGISVAVLMEYAGSAVARTARQLLNYRQQNIALNQVGFAESADTGAQNSQVNADFCKRAARLPIHIICGHGQNAGDALVAARLLAAEGEAVSCYLDGNSKGTPEYSAQLRTVRALGIPCFEFADFNKLTPEPALIIDGVFGTGFQTGRPLNMATTACFRQVAAFRSAGGLVLAVDIPSGLDSVSGDYADDAIKADATITFLYPKTGLVTDPGRDLAGKISLDRLSVPAAVLDQLLSSIRSDLRLPEIIDPAEVRKWAPERPRRLHKTQSGRALLIAGGPGLGGAALLASESTLRSGAGLLNILTDESIVNAVLTRLPEAMVLGLHGEADAEAAARLTAMFAKEPKAVGVGPGLAVNKQSAALIETVIRQAPKLVIDAGALTVIAADPGRFYPLLRSRSTESGLPPAVLTPHPGEFRRLAPEYSELPCHDAAARLADLLNCVVVLKGAATVIAEPRGRILINTTGNNGLASGGSGDVLTGLLLGFLAQGMAELPAAAAAVYLHGSAADIAVHDSTTRALIPSDLIRFFPEVFRRVGWDSEQPVNSIIYPDGGSCQK